MTKIREDLPVYRSHKKVRAVAISAIEIHEDGSATIAPGDANCDVFRTDVGYDSKFKGRNGDIGVYVQYDDGYESWSPTKPFMDGYTLVQ